MNALEVTQQVSRNIYLYINHEIELELVEYTMYWVSAESESRICVAITGHLDGCISTKLHFFLILSADNHTRPELNAWRNIILVLKK